MSCIHLHLGQAGNQIGKSFWGLAEDEFFVGDRGSVNPRSLRPRARARERRPGETLLRPGGTAMFHEDGSARCLAVDSEPKVVHSFQEHVGSIRSENAIFSQSGLANNWAMGFASCRDDGGGGGGGGRDGSSDGSVFNRCMESMRREAERSCCLNSVVMTHSLAGGTGSGLGSGILQALRDEYPSLYLISICVGPFETGDTPLQHYNSALALHHLQTFADAVIYRGNDDLLLGARASAGYKRSNPAARGVGGRGKRGVGAVSTTDMNLFLALDLGSYFFPTTRSVNLDPSYCVSGSSRTPRLLLQATVADNHHHRHETIPRHFDGGSLMAAACPLPGVKFVDLRSTLSVIQGASFQAPSLMRSGELQERSGGGSLNSTAEDWASLACDLGKTAPLCPRKGGGQSDDACVAAHHVVRGVDTGVCRSGGGEAGQRRSGWETRGGGGTAVMSVVAAAVEGASRETSEALRRHHECPEERTVTDVSCSPALRARAVERSVTTVCNQTRIRHVLENVIIRAEEKFKARAYLHWYYRHGLEDEDFLSAVEGVRTVERSYDGLAKAFGSGDGSSVSSRR